MSKAIKLIDDIDGMFRQYCDENKSSVYNTEKLAALIQRRLELTCQTMDLATAEVNPNPKQYEYKSFMPLNAVSKGIDIQLSSNGSLDELIKIWEKADGHGCCKIPLIRFVREHTGCGLREGKDYIDTKFSFKPILYMDRHSKSSLVF